MKGNSIEEDIEIIESIIEEYENCSVPEIDMQVDVTFREKQNNALNHILSDYKRVLKENEKYKRLAEMNLKNAEEFKNNMCEHRCLLKSENEELKTLKDDIQDKRIVYVDTPEFEENYIPVQKIKDKIEEIEEEKLCYSEDEWYIEDEIKGYAIDKLQELLEEGEENTI